MTWPNAAPVLTAPSNTCDVTEMDLTAVTWAGEEVALLQQGGRWAGEPRSGFTSWFYFLALGPQVSQFTGSDSPSVRRGQCPPCWAAIMTKWDNLGESTQGTEELNI